MVTETRGRSQAWHGLKGEGGLKSMDIWVGLTWELIHMHRCNMLEHFRSNW